MDAKEMFIGTWKLKSYKVQNEKGEIIYPFGKKYLGYLIYSADSYVSLTIMSLNRPRCASDNILAVTLEESLKLQQSYMAYVAQYEIKDRIISHHIKASLFPNLTDTTQERFFEFKKNTLILTTPNIEFVWQKART